MGQSIRKMFFDRYHKYRRLSSLLPSNDAYFRTFRGGDSDVETALDKMGVDVKRFPHRQEEMARKRLVVRAEGKYKFEQEFDEGNKHRAPMSEEAFKLRQRQGIY